MFAVVLLVLARPWETEADGVGVWQLLTDSD